MGVWTVVMRDTVTERADGSGMFAPSAGLSTQQSLGSSLQLTKFGLQVFSQVTALVNSQVFGPFLGPKFPKFPNDDFSVRVLTHPSRPLTRQETSKKKKTLASFGPPRLTAAATPYRRRGARAFGGDTTDLFPSSRSGSGDLTTHARRIRGAARAE